MKNNHFITFKQVLHSPPGNSAKGILGSIFGYLRLQFTAGIGISIFASQTTAARLDALQAGEHD